jgi:predicted lipoprotein with Yx(FWY)xxD motif
MAARTGREGTLTAARATGGVLAAVALSAGALFASTLASSPPAQAVGFPGKSLTIITEHVQKIGTVLATQSGLTLYRYTVDPAGKATCTGACAKVWPPALLPKGVTHIKAPRGVKGLTARRVHGGRFQVFFHGQALYHFVSDSKKGVASGQGVENDWFAVLSNGKSSASASAATPAGSGAGSSGSGSGSGSASGGSSGTSTSTTSPSTSKTPTGGGSTPSSPTTAPVTKSPPTTSPPTTAPPTTTPPTTAPPTTTPPTSPPTTTTTTAPPTGGTGF